MTKKISQLDPLATPPGGAILPLVDPVSGSTRRSTAEQLAESAIFASRWDDLRFPATGINPPGPVDAPTRDETTGLLAFNATSERVVTALAQMPHAWKEGSAIRPHVHFVKPATGAVIWNLQTRIMPARGGAFPAVWTNRGNASLVGGDTDATTGIVIASWPEIDMTGFAISAMVLFRLARLGADPGDTMPGDATLIEFDVHYQIDAAGSIGEYDKDGV